MFKKCVRLFRLLNFLNIWQYSFAGPAANCPFSNATFSSEAVFNIIVEHRSPDVIVKGFKSRKFGKHVAITAFQS